MCKISSYYSRVLTKVWTYSKYTIFVLQEQSLLEQPGSIMAKV